MDQLLHCNNLKCRALCSERAVVTTCSHIFCLSCADRLELAAPKDGQRKCPACHTALNNPDDAVVAQLDPSEDYKTSILSGLNPTVIVECAGRALSFWNYQLAQETMYQAYVGRTLTEKYTILNEQLDRTIREYNGELQSLQTKLDNSLMQKDTLEDRYRKLETAYREKDKKFKQVDRLYRGLKYQQLAPGVELAAEHNTEDYIQTTTTHPPDHHMRGRRPNDRHGSDSGSGMADQRRGRPEVWPNFINPTVAAMQRDGLPSARSWPNRPSPQTRQRLPVQPGLSTLDPGLSNSLRNGALHQGTPVRRGNSYEASQYGMTAGIRQGRPSQAIPISCAGGSNAQMPGLGGLNAR